MCVCVCVCVCVCMCVCVCVCMCGFLLQPFHYNHLLDLFLNILVPVTLLLTILSSSSSSSCHAASTDFSYTLSPLLPIVHRFWSVLRATPLILTELLYVGSSWSSCFCPAI